MSPYRQTEVAQQGNAAQMLDKTMCMLKVKLWKVLERLELNHALYPKTAFEMIFS